MKNYEDINLQQEDSYDDSDYQPYELMDYKCQEEEEETTVEPQLKKKKKTRKQTENEPSEEYDFYNTVAQIESGTASKKRYEALAKAACSDDEQVCKRAREEACFYMKGLVRDMIRGKYRTYIENDPEFASDLEQEAYANIIKYLPEYDSSKGNPSTFFYYHIKSAIAGSTNSMKHHISSADTALKRKILNLNKIYEKMGRKPTIGDYMVETNETMSKIRSVLAMMETDMNTHLEAIPEYDQLIPGDAHANSMFAPPEQIVIKNMTYESVIKRMRDMFTVKEVDIFLRYFYNEETIASIAMDYAESGSDDKIRRIIEKVKHGIQYDPQSRAAYYGSNDCPQMSVVEFFPTDRINETIDLLSSVAL